MYSPDWLLSLDNIGFIVVRALLSILWQSSILLCAIGLIIYLLRHRKDTVGHILWVGAVIMIPLIPLLSWGLLKIGPPHAIISVMPSYSDPHTRAFQSQLKHQSALKMQLPQEKKQVLAGIGDVSERFVPMSSRTYVLNGMEGKERAMIRLSVSDYTWALVFIGYAVIVMLFLVWDQIGRLCIRSLIMRSGAVTDERIIEVFEDVKNKLGLAKDLIIVENEHVFTPMTFRTFKPVVILPTGFAEALTTKELQAVALHELSHIKRCDVFIFSVIYLLKAVFFFHPLVWVAARQVSYLAEIECDNAVVAHTGETFSYAGLLTRLAENVSNKKYSFFPAAGIIVTKSTFFRRIEFMLVNRKNRIRKLTPVALAGVTTAVTISILTALSFPLGDAKKDGEMVMVTGKVVCEGKAVTDAKIYLSEHLSKNAVRLACTGTDGIFTCEIPRAKLILPQRSMPALIAFKNGYSVGWAKLSSVWGISDLTIQLGKPETITGTVVDPDGNPVKGVNISIRGLYAQQFGEIVEYDYDALDCRDVFPGHDARTDKNGRFVIHNVPEGIDIGLAFDVKGYAELYTKNIPAGMKKMVVTLIPGGSIEGRITYANTGKSARNIEVMMERITGRNESINYSTESATGLTGHFRVKNLLPGDYTVFLKNQLSGWTAVAKTHIRVEEGKTTQAGNLTLIRGGFVTGRLIDRDTNEPLKGHLIRYTDASHPALKECHFTHTNTTSTDENGYYCFRAAPGDVTISTTGTDEYEINYFSTTVNCSEYETITTADFYLQKAMTVTGKVLSTNGESVAGLRVFIPQEKLFHGGYAGLDDYVTTDAQGRFTINGLKECENLELKVYHARLNFSWTVSFDVQPDHNVDIL